MATGAVQLDLASEELTGLRRDEFGSSATPAILAKAFELEIGQSEAITDGSEVVVVTLNASERRRCHIRGRGHNPQRAFIAIQRNPFQ